LIYDIIMSGGGRCFIIFGTQWLTRITELDCGKPLNHIRSPSPLSEDAFCQCCVSVSIFDVTVTQYLNIPHFRPEKEGFWSPEDKRPRVGSGHYHLILRWPVRFGLGSRCKHVFMCVHSISSGLGRSDEIVCFGICRMTQIVT